MELSETAKYKTISKKIYSLKNTDPSLKGSFFLGTGSIDSVPQYSMFVDHDKDSKKQFFVKATTPIYEDDTTPRYDIKLCREGLRYNFWSGFIETTSKCEYRIKTELHVPKGTITTDFNI